MTPMTCYTLYDNPLNRLISRVSEGQEVDNRSGTV